MAFTSSSERSRQRWNRLSLVPPLMGFECRPPTDIPPARPLPGAEAPFGPTSPGAGSRSVLVVSHHHNGLLRAEVTGLLHPATGQGFAAFHVRPPARPKAGRRGKIPATRFTPFEEFPSSAAAPHHCGRCLPAVTVLSGAGEPAEAGVRAERRPPRRVAYTRCPARGSPKARPRREGLPVPREMVRASPEAGSPGASEEVRVPCPGERGRPRSEELGVPCPGGGRASRRDGRAVLRGAPSARSRGEAAGPVGLGAGASEEVRSPGSGGAGSPGPPRRSGLPVPAAGRAVLRRAPVADAGEAVRAVLRRAPSAVPRWAGVPAPSRR